MFLLLGFEKLKHVMNEDIDVYLLLMQRFKNYSLSFHIHQNVLILFQKLNKNCFHFFVKYVDEEFEMNQ